MQSCVTRYESLLTAWGLNVPGDNQARPVAPLLSRISRSWSLLTGWPLLAADDDAQANEIRRTFVWRVPHDPCSPSARENSVPTFTAVATLPSICCISEVSPAPKAFSGTLLLGPVRP